MSNLYINKNYYDILEIKEEANQDEIRKAYKRLALKWHPVNKAFYLRL